MSKLHPFWYFPAPVVYFPDPEGEKGGSYADVVGKMWLSVPSHKYGGHYARTHGKIWTRDLEGSYGGCYADR